MAKLMSPVKMRVKVYVEVTPERIGDLLITAFEGGSNYWIKSVLYVRPHGLDVFKIGTLDSLKFVPLFGGSIEIDAGEGEVIQSLDGNAILNGLNVMADKYPKHFGYFLDENDDAETADVFLQCCLYSEVIFG